MRKTSLVRLFFAAILTAGMAGAVEDGMTNQPPPIDVHAIGSVAQVGHSRIGADQVFELWTPVWYETLAKVRNGKLSTAEGDDKLTGEWRRAITALVKDELFFQEAEREHNAFINAIVDNIMRQGAGKPRTQIAGEIRRLMRQDMDRYFKVLNAELVKDAGGMVKLHKVLEGRGLTFLEWQNRLKKKAFTQTYLHQILKPRAPDPGPRQIQDYYSNHPEEFTRPGLVAFKHIFFSNALRSPEQAMEDAIEVWQDIADGLVDFASAARQHSDDPESKGRGGQESGEEAIDPEREAWLADIRTALREERPGELAPILESPFGCHIAMLVDIGPDRRVPFNDVKKEIERKLQNEIWEAETDRYFLSIRRNTEIKVLMPNFPPNLSCAAQAGLDSSSPKVYRMANPEIRTRQSGGRRGSR